MTSNDTTLSPVIVDLDYSPTEIYQSSGNSTKTNYEIRYCNVPFITTDSNSVYKWKDRLNYTSSDEIDSVKKILTYQLKLSTHTTSIQKIKTIGHFLYSSLKNSFGVPPDSLANYSTYQQFCMAKDGKQKIWCGNITDIFHLFASAAGLTTRKIGFSGKKYGFTTGEHTANECYIPETGEWAYVDITQNILLLTNEYHKIVNTIDLIHLKKMNQTDKLITFKSTDSSIVQSNYDYPDKKYGWEENEIYFVHPHNPSTLYSFSNKLKRYFTRSPWIELYSENQYYSNQKFYLKIYLFYTWVLIGLLILISYLFTFKRTH